MAQDFSSIELADVAKEVNGNLVIHFHTATIRLDKEQLEFLRKNGHPTHLWGCITAAFVFAKKSEAELNAFLEEAKAAQSGVRIEFVGDDGMPLNVVSKEANPMLDQLVSYGDGTVSVGLDDDLDDNEQ